MNKEREREKSRPIRDGVQRGKREGGVKKEKGGEGGRKERGHSEYN